MKYSDSLRKVSDNSGIKVNLQLLTDVILKEAEKRMAIAAKKGEYEVNINFRGVFLSAKVPKKEMQKKSFVSLIDQYDKLMKNNVKLSKWANNIIREFNKFGYVCETLLYNDPPRILMHSDEEEFRIPGRGGFAGLKIRWNVVLNPVSDLSRKTDKEIDDMIRKYSSGNYTHSSSSNPFNPFSF